MSNSYTEEKSREDHLNRGAIVDRVLQRLTSRPPVSEQDGQEAEQVGPKTVRVGLYGPWGTGKSTLCHLIKEKAEAEGHMVIELSLWSIKPNGIWQALHDKFRQKLKKKCCLRLKTWAYHALPSPHIKFWINLFLALGAIVFLFFWAIGCVGPLNGGEVVNASLLGVAAAFLLNSLKGLGEIGPEFFQSGLGKKVIEGLRKQLPKEKTIIVILDDLDRADPKAVPEILLALREPLEQDGVSYLLTFDREMVATALQHHHKGFDESFLEKIIDWDIHLPELAPHQRKEFLLRLVKELPDAKDYLDLKTLESLADIFPETPRSIKRFVRHLENIGTVKDRFDKEELHWPSVYSGLFMFLESYSFFCKVRKNLSEIKERRFGLNFMPSEKKKYQEKIDSLIGQLVNEEKSTNVYSYRKALLSSWLEYVSGADLNAEKYLGFSFSWAVQDSFPLTIKEFHALLADYREDEDLCLEGWLEDQLRRSKSSAAEIIKEVLRLTQDSIKNALEKYHSEAPIESELYLYQFDTNIEFYITILDVLGHKLPHSVWAEQAKELFRPVSSSPRLKELAQFSQTKEYQTLSATLDLAAGRELGVILELFKELHEISYWEGSPANKLDRRHHIIAFADKVIDDHKDLARDTVLVFVQTRGWWSVVNKIGNQSSLIIKHIIDLELILKLVANNPYAALQLLYDLPKDYPDAELTRQVRQNEKILNFIQEQSISTPERSRQQVHMAQEVLKLWARP